MSNGIIERDVYITKFRRIEPICVVYGSAVPICLTIKDYAFSGTGYTAKARATADKYAGYMESTIEASNISTTNKTITFTPPYGFFRDGRGEVQIDLLLGNDHILTFNIPVVCETNMTQGEITGNPDFLSLTERAEAAATRAESAYGAVSSVNGKTGAVVLSATDVGAAAASSLAEKQDKLVAGTGISINGNTISATGGGGGSGGSTISVSRNLTSGTKVAVITVDGSAYQLYAPSVSGMLKYTTQSLTEAQQSQARSNIGFDDAVNALISAQLGDLDTAVTGLESITGMGASE